MRGVSFKLRQIISDINMMDKIPTIKIDKSTKECHFCELIKETSKTNVSINYCPECGRKIE